MLPTQGRGNRRSAGSQKSIVLDVGDAGLDAGRDLCVYRTTTGPCPRPTRECDECERPHTDVMRLRPAGAGAGGGAAGNARARGEGASVETHGRGGPGGGA